MAIEQHLTEFAGKRVEDWDPSKGIADPSGTAYRVSDDERWLERFGEFLADPRSSEVAALVVGMWDREEHSSGEWLLDGSGFVVQALVEARERLPNLRALFVGDITLEENEISWIEQSTMAPLLQAYPHLEHLGVRGASGLSFTAAHSLVARPVRARRPRAQRPQGLLSRLFGKRQEPPQVPPPPPPSPPPPNVPIPFRHAHLKTLIVESGGLDAGVVREILDAHLPALEHLELWLGQENYGGTTTVADLEPILSGRLFPKLRTLGLKDSEFQNDIAAAAAHSPLLERIQVLDLSLGTLDDEGAEALLASPAVARLRKLDVHHHFLSKEMMAKVRALGIEVDLGEPQLGKYPGEHRYVAVGE